MNDTAAHPPAELRAQRLIDCLEQQLLDLCSLPSSSIQEILRLEQQIEEMRYEQHQHEQHQHEQHQSFIEPDIICGWASLRGR